MTIRFFGRHSPGASLLILLVATVASAADVRSPASQNWDSIVKEPRRKGRSLSIRIYLFSGVLVFSLCPIKSGCCTNEHKDPVMIDAALVIPVYRSRDGELRIVMILRQPGGVHGGQVAFPGGKRDPEDETMLDTALREAREELGLMIDRSDVLAELPVLRRKRRVTVCSRT